jgi:cGMP-dependent protein kinase
MGRVAFQTVATDGSRIMDYMRRKVDLQNAAVELTELLELQVVGRGGSATVKMVQSDRTKVRYALKCVNRKTAVDKGLQQALQTERSILAEIDHPFMVKFVRTFRDEAGVYFLMELVTGGELCTALDHLGVLSRHQAQFYMGCLALALEFLHVRRIAYMDLKSENCLIDHHGYVKLIDFGLAERITGGRAHVVKGTPCFMAPEVVRAKGYTCSADLWSLGVCLYEFVVGKLPFGANARGPVEIFREVLKAPLKFPEGFESKPSRSLIQGLLTRDPAKRLGSTFEGFNAIKDHEFFHGLCWDKLLAMEVEPPYVPSEEIFGSAHDTRQSSTFDIWGVSIIQQEPVSKSLAHEAHELRELRWRDPEPGWDREF